MKRFFIIALAALLACLMPTALAEEEAADAPEGGAAFVGDWMCGRATIQILEAEAGYTVYIRWGGSAFDTAQWRYDCAYDPSADALKGTGSRENVTYAEDGEVAATESVFEDGGATFTLEGGLLRWDDAVEHAGADMAFERVQPEGDEPEGDGDDESDAPGEVDPAGQPFLGAWGCGRATLDITAEDGGLRAFISWGASAAEVDEWSYACRVEGDRLVGESGEKSVLIYGEDGSVASESTVYTDGEAVFALDGEGRLTWDDAVEHAGADMAFERLAFYSFAPGVEALKAGWFEPLASLPVGTAGASLAAAQAARDALRFAVDFDLANLSDPENLAVNLKAVWDDLSAEDQQAFIQGFGEVSALVEDCFDRWQDNRGAFEDAGVLEDMEALLGDAGSRDDWRVLRDATLAMG